MTKSISGEGNSPYVKVYISPETKSFLAEEAKKVKVQMGRHNIPAPMSLSEYCRLILENHANELIDAETE